MLNWNPEHALRCNVCDASLVLQTGGWLCRICVPHEPVAQGGLMCLQGHRHHQDGLIYERGRRGASTVSGQQTQGGSKSKRPKLAGSALECNGGDGQESDEVAGQPEGRDPVRHEGLVAASRAMSGESAPARAGVHSLVHDCLALPGLHLQPWSPTARNVLKILAVSNTVSGYVPRVAAHMQPPESTSGVG